MLGNITVSVQGARETADRFQKAVTELKNLKPEMGKIGAYLVDTYTNGLFVTEGGIIGARWANLSPRYGAWKRRKYGGRGTLERTGKMRRSYIAQAHTMSVDVINTIDYAKYHHFGTSRMPKRVLVGVGGRIMNTVADILVTGIQKRLT